MTDLKHVSRSAIWRRLERPIDGLRTLRDKFRLATTASGVPPEVAEWAKSVLPQIEWPIEELDTSLRACAEAPQSTENEETKEDTRSETTEISPRLQSSASVDGVITTPAPNKDVGAYIASMADGDCFGADPENECRDVFSVDQWCKSCLAVEVIDWHHAEVERFLKAARTLDCAKCGGKDTRRIFCTACNPDMEPAVIRRVGPNEAHIRADELRAEAPATDTPFCKDDEHLFGPCKTCGMPHLASRLELPTADDIAWAQRVLRAEALAPTATTAIEKLNAVIGVLEEGIENEEFGRALRRAGAAKLGKHYDDDDETPMPFTRCFKAEVDYMREQINTLRAEALAPAPDTSSKKQFPPPADAKEWTCKTCGMDCLWCNCPAPHNHNR